MKFGRGYVAGWAALIVAWGFLFIDQKWFAVAFTAISLGCFVSDLKRFERKS